jgi:hypothetical protein
MHETEEHSHSFGLYRYCDRKRVYQLRFSFWVFRRNMFLSISVLAQVVRKQI